MSFKRSNYQKPFDNNQRSNKKNTHKNWRNCDTTELQFQLKELINRYSFDNIDNLINELQNKIDRLLQFEEINYLKYHVDLVSLYFQNHELLFAIEKNIDYNNCTNWETFKNCIEELYSNLQNENHNYEEFNVPVFNNTLYFSHFNVWAIIVNFYSMWKHFEDAPKLLFKYTKKIPKHAKPKPQTSKYRKTQVLKPINIGQINRHIVQLISVNNDTNILLFKNTQFNEFVQSWVCPFQVFKVYSNDLNVLPALELDFSE